MKTITPRLMTTLLPLMMLFTSYTNAGGKNHVYQSIEKAFKDGTIDLKIRSTGLSHSGECMVMEIINTRRDSGFYQIEAGRRLKSDDHGMQDMLITRPEQMALRGKEKTTITVFAFCCQAHRGAPGESAKYTVGRMASKDLVAIAQFLSRHEYALYTMQSAIWVVSDNNDISTVTAPSMDSIHDLLDTLRIIKHLEFAGYGISVPKQSYTVDRHMYNCDLFYHLKGNAIVAIEIYDEHGTKIMSYYEKPATPETYVVPISVNTKGWTHGVYTINVLKNDNRILQRGFLL